MRRAHRLPELVRIVLSRFMNPFDITPQDRNYSEAIRALRERKEERSSQNVPQEIMNTINYSVSEEDILQWTNDLNEGVSVSKAKLEQVARYWIEQHDKAKQDLISFRRRLALICMEDLAPHPSEQHIKPTT